MSTSTYPLSDFIVSGYAYGVHTAVESGQSVTMNDLVTAMRAVEYPIFQYLVDRTELDLMEENFYILRFAIGEEGQEHKTATKILLSSGKLNLGDGDLISFLIEYGSIATIRYWMSLVTIEPDALEGLISFSLEVDRPEVADLFRNPENINIDLYYTESDLNDAIRDNDLKLVKTIIYSGVDPSDDDNFAIRNSARLNHSKIVEFLLRFPTVDPSVDHNSVFQYMAHFGHTDILRTLMEDPRVDPTDMNNRAIRNAASNNHIDTVNYIWSLQDRFPTIKDAFIGYNVLRYQAMYGNVEMIKFLLQFPGVDTPENIEEALRSAQRFSRRAGRREIITFLEEYQASQHYTVEDLIAAAKTGNMELVQRTIRTGVDPSMNGNEAMYSALAAGQYPMVEYLEKFDPHQGDDDVSDLKDLTTQLFSFKLWDNASIDNWNRAVDFVSHPRFPSVLVNYVFQEAVSENRIEFINRLLSHPKIDLAANNNINLQNAIWNQNERLIEYLSENPYVRDGEIYFKIRDAVRDTNPEIIQLLVERFDFDLSQNNNDLLMAAAISKNSSNLEYVLSRPGVRMDAQNYKALRIAAHVGNVDSVVLLLNAYRSDPNLQSPDYVEILTAAYDDVTDALAHPQDVDLSTYNLQRSDLQYFQDYYLNDRFLEDHYRQIQEILRTEIEEFSSY